MTAGEVVETCRQHALQHVVLTGGEPLIYKQLSQLTSPLKAAQFHITIETAGTLYRKLDCDLISISPKLASSAPQSGFWQQRHEQRREKLDVVAQLMDSHEYQLKFVVDSEADAEEVLQYVDRLRQVVRKPVPPSRILLMPQGVDSATLQRQADWLIPWCQDHDLRFCPRAHIGWFGNQRGT